MIRDRYFPTRSARLFQEFSQVDTNLDRRFGGSGLGLAITGALGHADGGQNWLSFCARVLAALLVYFTGKTSSEVHEKIYQTKWELLPITGIAGGRQPDQPNGGNCHAGKKVGCKLAISNDGFEAIDMVQKADFDVVLMDVSMPGNGWF